MGSEWASLGSVQTDDNPRCCGRRRQQRISCGRRRRDQGLQALPFKVCPACQGARVEESPTGVEEWCVESEQASDSHHQAARRAAFGGRSVASQSRSCSTRPTPCGSSSLAASCRCSTRCASSRSWLAEKKRKPVIRHEISSSVISGSRPELPHVWAARRKVGGRSGSIVGRYQPRCCPCTHTISNGPTSSCPTIYVPSPCPDAPHPSRDVHHRRVGC